MKISARWFLGFYCFNKSPILILTYSEFISMFLMSMALSVWHLCPDVSTINTASLIDGNLRVSLAFSKVSRNGKTVLTFQVKTVFGITGRLWKIPFIKRWINISWPINPFGNNLKKGRQHRFSCINGTITETIIIQSGEKEHNFS